MNYCIVHFNTPELTTCLCSSINKFDKNASIIIFENSNKRPITNIFDNVKIIDNSREQLIRFTDAIDESKKYLSTNSLNRHLYSSKNNFGSLKHSVSIQYLLDNMNEDFMLLDSDVLIKQNLDELITDKICSASPSVTNKRILPFIIYFNIEKIKQNNIKFFDARKMDACFEETDTGGSFYKELLDKKLKFNKFDWTKYCIHFGNGSWRLFNYALMWGQSNTSSSGTYQEFLMRNKSLWK